MYQYALILYHLTTARGLGSGARSVSENAKVNSRRFGSPPAEICGDLLKVATARNPPRCTPVREGRAVVVASPPVARWWPVGVPARRHEAVTRHGRGFQLCWCWRVCGRVELVAVRGRCVVCWCARGYATRRSWSGRMCCARRRGRPALPRPRRRRTGIITQDVQI